MPELRRDPVTGRWVIIATERVRRASDFLREPVVNRPNGSCPYCAGNEFRNPHEILVYRNGHGGPPWSVRVVPNKFPVLGIEGDLDREGEGMFDRMAGIGAHEVIIESPDHQIDLAGLSDAQVERVVWAWRERVLDLKRDARLRYILIFKNHGEAAGAAFDHAHSQLIAVPIVPRRVQEELDGARAYYGFKERCVYCDMLRQESSSGTRLVMETDRYAVIEPYASRFPFETWIVPRRHGSHFEETDAAALPALASVLRTTLAKIGKALESPAYNLVIHTAPVAKQPLPHYHWHIEIMPKLTRVAGFEWGSGMYINPTPPEEAAAFLREAGL